MDEISLQPIAMPPEDAALLNARYLTMAEIAALFRVPAELIQPECMSLRSVLRDLERVAAEMGIEVEMADGAAD